MNRYALLGAALLCAAACSSKPAPAPAAGQPGATGQAPAPAVAHGADATGGLSDLTKGGAASEVPSAVGTVQETMDGGGYTYVRVKSGDKELWAATSQFKVAVGETVTVPLESTMQNFHSPALNRDFPLIYFVSQISKGNVPPAAPAAAGGDQGLPPGHAKPSSNPTASAAPTEPIAPPAGGIQIAKLWSDKKALAGKSVTLRGKVVKYNPGILGSNWLHLQDGSGKAADQTHDITVTTSDEATLGSVVTVTGTVTLDKDFGAGYAYSVIVEKAKVSK